MKVRLLRRRRGARIRDYKPAARLLLPLEVLHYRGHGFGGVAAHKQDRLRARDVFHWEREPLSTPNALIEAAAAEDMQNRPL